MSNPAVSPPMPSETAPRQSRAAASGTGGLWIERRSLAACAALEADWRNLVCRAIEPNPFFEPDFALAAAQHLVDFRDAPVLLVWGGSPASRRLLGFIPGRLQRRLLGRDELIGWSNPRLGIATPLIDRSQAGRVVAALLHAPGQLGLAGARNLHLPSLDRDGALLPVLLQTAEHVGHAALIQPVPEPATAGGAPDLAALRHGLTRYGRLSFSESGSRQELRDMVELHLALEASGARGHAGLAALQDVRESAFLRSMTRSLAWTRRCRAGLLSLDDKPIAGAILVGKGSRLWLHSGVEDDRFASFAPLAQLVSWLGRSSRREIVGRVPGPHAVTAPQRLGSVHLAVTAKAARQAPFLIRRRATAA
ncbi:GNAT family N-acetyltransferase [Bosea sp. CS1GBMeth4]|uniref:GNAT family N-acetyltransferase n=1 Tax=Bosea sp. CS1GBMeth4 TaxID=1892849 RepID=UPI00164598D6|nr:GNAT family N-acetyltransferase [Bosea sp. CS1GBMeth4]